MNDPAEDPAVSPSPEVLEAICAPSSVAVIGASANPAKIGHQILRNIVEGGFSGPIYPIHPKEGEILGLKAYPDIEAAPGPVDQAVIAIPAPLVEATLEACGRKGVRCAAVITSGFGEVGRIEEEKRLKAIADRYGMALLGPNMFGVVYTPARFNASFGPRDLLPGRLAFISQSGALAIALMGWTKMERIGLAALINLGNKAGVEERDLIGYFSTDPNVDVVLCYMEGVKDGRAFMKTPITKPVVILKVGRSRRGAKAAASHTGSLAGSDRIYDAAFKQLGILRPRTFDEAFQWGRTLSLPVPRGGDVVIITNGGGIGVAATDEAEAAGIRLMADAEWLEAKFRKTMPDFGSTKNPVDITGQSGADGYAGAVAVALEEDRVHAVMVLYCETVITDPLEIARIVREAYDRSGRRKPLLMVMVGGERSREAILSLNESGIPAFGSVSAAVSSLRALYRWKEISERPREEVRIEPPPEEAAAIIERARKEGRTALLEHEARRVLELCGVAGPPSAVAADVEEAVRAAEGLYPLAMKIVSQDILHKTDVGGVVLNIRDADELRRAYEAMTARVRTARPDARIQGVHLVKMVRGIECIVGLNHDPQFGPAVMFGLGGVFVEALKDVAFRVVPFGPREAERLLDDIAARSVLDGFRGMKADRPSLVTALCAVQRIAPLVEEVDINPLMSSQEGSFAVDARIIIRP